MPVVEVNNAAKAFGHRAVVSDLSFTVEAGEIFGLIGPNGAGKTTTIRMMMDLIVPDSGQVRVLGQSRGGDIRGNVGYLPSRSRLPKDLCCRSWLVRPSVNILNPITRWRRWVARPS